MKNRAFIPSAAGLRRNDLSTLQQRFAALGLSSLGRCKAHVPAIWATQVLESMVKQDIPGSVVSRMRHRQLKKTAQFRALHW